MAENIKVVIDSSVFRQDPSYSKQETRLLSELSKKRLISVIVPHIIYHEYLTGVISEATTSINKSISSLKEAGRQGISEVLKNKISKQLLKLENLKVLAISDIENEWNKFLESGKFVRSILKEDLLTPVMNSYFEGLPPFSYRKSRNDIPDALIYEEVKTLSSTATIHVACADKDLREALGSLSNVLAFPDYQGLFGSAALKPLVAEHSASKEAIDLIHKSSKSFGKYAVAYLNGITPFDFDIDLPYANSETVTITSIDTEKTEIDYSNTQHIDESFYIPIKVRASTEFEYYIDKSIDFLESGSGLSTEDWNDNVFVTETTWTCDIMIVLTIQEDEILGRKNLDLAEIDIEHYEIEQMEVVDQGIMPNRRRQRYYKRK